MQGESAVDESMVTGESAPVHKKPGDGAIGGTVNREGMLPCQGDKSGRRLVSIPGRETG